MLLKLIRSLKPRRATEHVESLRLRAQVLYRAGRYAEAELLYKGLLDLRPQDAHALFELGVACHQQGRLHEAFRHCERALAISPDHPEWVGSLAHTANDLGKAEGVAACEKRIIEDGDFVSWLALGNALRESDRLQEAENAYRRCLEQVPSSPYAMRRLGSLLALSGRLEEADACFRVSACAGLAPDPLLRFSSGFLDALERNRESLLDGLPQIEGEWANSPSALVAFACCDTVYFRKFAWPLSSSIIRNAQVDCLVHIHVINPEPALYAEMETLCAGLGSGRVVCTWEHTALPEDGSAKTYYASARLLHLPRVIERYARPVLALDMDVLVLGSLERVLQAAGNGDLALVRWHATRWDPWDCLWASAVLARHTPGAISILQRAALFTRHFLLHGPRHWFLDQVALFAAIECWPAQDCRGRVIYLPAAMAMLCGSSAEEEKIQAEVVFWSVIHSLESNRGALARPPFTDYLPETRDSRS
jgi:hypothetical protein